MQKAYFRRCTTEVGLEASISLYLNYNVSRIYGVTDCFLVSITLAGKDINSMTLLAMVQAPLSYDHMCVR